MENDQTHSLSRTLNFSIHLSHVSFSLTSTVHEFAHVGCGHDVVGPQVVCQLPSDWHNDGHDQMRQSRHHPHLGEREREMMVENKTCKSFSVHALHFIHLSLYDFFLQIIHQLSQQCTVNEFTFLWLRGTKSRKMDVSSNLADRETKDLLEVCRLTDEEQVECPATAKVGHYNGIHRHRGEELAPRSVKLLQRADKRKR